MKTARKRPNKKHPWRSPATISGYKKRTESSLVTACLGYLQCLENAGSIKYVDRRNSGRFFKDGRMALMCRPGTPDIVVYLNNGKTLHIECKIDDEVLSGSQVKFRAMIDELYYHHFILIRSTNELKDVLGKEFGVCVG